jgi:cellulose synthase/poly-beta-1,6-N-acetylglucosamine synthase-like glycosyltransferase
MNLLEKAALELITSFWVLQSAAALLKTRRAHRLFLDHQRKLDRAVAVKEIQRVALVIAVKGLSDSFERFLDFALGQDYPDYHVIFVTESVNDPAYAVIQDRLRNSLSPVARLIVAGHATDAAQKIHNQLAAFKELETSDQIIAFADSDLYARKNWLSSLALPLNLGQADFTTGFRWFIPADHRLPNRIATLMATAMEPLIGPSWRMCLWGGSMAMTRKVFDELEIPVNLAGSVNDDVRISQLARRAGKRMRYVRSVAASSPIDFTWASLFEFGRRQYFHLRVGQPSLWWMALMIPVLFLAGFITCLIRLGQGNWLMLIPIAAAILLNLGRTRVRRSYLRARFKAGEAETLDAAVRGSWWLDPLINISSLLIILSSACGREIVWAGIRYHVSGPQATRVLSGKDTSPAVPGSPPSR